MATIYDLDMLNKQVEILRDALAQYANPDNWEIDRIKTNNRLAQDALDEVDMLALIDASKRQIEILKAALAECDIYLKVFFVPGDSGYDVAQAALEKADKLIHKDLWSKNT